MPKNAQITIQLHLFHMPEDYAQNVKTVSYFIFLAFKINADSDCSHEIKRHLLLGRIVTTNLDSMLKSWDITLQTKAHIVKAMVFPIVMYSCVDVRVEP